MPALKKMNFTVHINIVVMLEKKNKAQKKNHTKWNLKLECHINWFTVEAYLGSY